MPWQGVSIDLGTMCSVIAGRAGRGGPAVLPDRDGRRGTPSVVAFDAGRALVGAPRPGAIRFVKTAVGDPTWRFRVDGMSLRSEEVTAVLLRTLRADAERALGRAVSEEVLTVPASFDAAARHAVAQAGRIAGLAAHRVVAEPTAAAVAYRRRIAVGRTALVYALGGGSCDVSVLHRDADGLAVLATAADRELGAWDWDNALLRLVLDRGVRAASVGGGEDGLRAAVEGAKLVLSVAPRVCVLDSVTVTRAEFERATGALLARTRRLVDAALAAAGVTAGGLDAVLLAGGPTRMPMVRRMLRTTLGRRPGTVAEPAEVVALGGALLDRVPVREVASLDLGVLARDATGTSRPVVLVRAGTPLPAAGTAVFHPLAEGQRRFVLEVTQGDPPVRQHREVLELPAGRPGPVEVSCAYDRDHRPSVRVRHVPSARPLAEFAVVGPAGLTDAEVAAAAERVRALTSG